MFWINGFKKNKTHDYNPNNLYQNKKNLNVVQLL